MKDSNLPCSYRYYTAVMALEKGNSVITKENLLAGIKKELAKETNLSAGDTK